GRYLENGCKRLEEITKYKIPDADTVYTRLSKKNFKEILDEFCLIQNKILSQIKDTKDGIVVFIDLN
ncbi:MAG: hypothetical protein H5T45_03315, partial [Thermoplasmatales archaeon]|nr:hypothetical protein [Thermoplasmatales archaeon]